MNDFPYILIISLISGALFGLIFVAHISLLFVFKEDLYKKNSLLFIRLTTVIIIAGFLAINFITFIFVILARLVFQNNLNLLQFNEYHLIVLMFISIIITLGLFLLPKYINHILIQMLICFIIFVIIIPNLLISLGVI
ncbi:MAG: hypothetical protein CL774_00260 [Chloroflexi bacterium]|nr:hypothetical protein [Chloroflexota bacterium]|tara:strand:+ start:6053 stop:6466 length:414 start_codon:yes stop_codon:yes gene_type:complete